MALEFSGSFLTRAGRSVPGSMIGVIDAMILYQGGAGPRINELYIVYKEADHWRKKHVNGLFATKQMQKEEAAIGHLMGTCLDELNAAQAGLGDALSGYQGRKIHQGPAGKTTSLGKGYDLERKTYLAGDKQSAPFSGSRIRDIADASQVDFHSISKKSWDQMSAKSGPDLQGQAPAVKMYFLNKVQRLKQLVVCVDQNPLGTRWVDLPGAHMNTLAPAGRTMASPEACQIYAMDRYGNLFVDYDEYAHGALVLNVAMGAKAASIAARGKTNHSSLCAGREVICAGMIFFWKGQLIHIDNKSGHYAPKRNALVRAVQILEEAGANLDYLRVGYATTTSEVLFKARTFLVNGQPDWPDQDANNDHTARYGAVPTFHP